MKKLKFMVELYNQECEKNKKYHEIFNRSKATIEEMKVEITRLTQSQAKAMNDLVLEKKSHARTVKKLEMYENNELQAPFNGSLRCICEVSISNGDID